MKEFAVSVPLFTVIPFLLMLFSIAVFPLRWNHFWEKNRNKLIVAVVLSLPIVIYLLSAGLEEKLFETMVFEATRPI